MLRRNLKTSAILILPNKSPTASVVEKNVSVITFHCLTGLTFHSKGYL